MICSTVSKFNDKVNALRKMFQLNAYPVSFFDNVLNSFNRRFSSLLLSNISTVSDNDLPIVVFNVPYLGKCSRDFGSCISKLITSRFPVKIRIVYSTFKVKSYFRLKCHSPLYLSSNVVYRFNCMDASCTDSYIGYTSRHLFERCGEHLNLKTSKQSEVKDHVKNCNACKQHTLSFRDFCVVRRCKSEVHAKLFEAFAIKRVRPALNKQLYAQGASKILHVWK